MPKVSQQYRDDRREQILAAGRRCFLRDGFHATSMQDLFTESGLSAGSVYRYFASKDDLIIAIAEENMRAVSGLIRELTVDQPGSSIGDAVAEVMEVIGRQHAANGLGGLAVQVWAEALRNAEVATRFTGLLTQLRVDLAGIVAQRQTSGELPGDVDPAAVATLLMSTIAGYLLQAALSEPAVIAGVPDAVRALTPTARERLTNAGRS